MPLGWPLIGAASALLLPALAGAVWPFAWYVTVALMLPGYVAYMVLGFRSAQVLEDSYAQRLPRQRTLGLGAIIGALIGFSVAAVPHYLDQPSLRWYFCWWRSQVGDPHGGHLNLLTQATLGRAYPPSLGSRITWRSKRLALVPRRRAAHREPAGGGTASCRQIARAVPTGISR